MPSRPAKARGKTAAPAPAPDHGAHADRTERMLRATLEELAVVGYRALSVEVVASKAGVNKTTVYRRWPTKRDLVQAALTTFVPAGAIEPDTGSARGDLLALGRNAVLQMSSIEGQGIFRVMAVESAEAELQEIGMAVRRTHEAQASKIIVRGIERGEIAKGTDPRLLLKTLFGALHLSLFFNNERVDDLLVTRIVDLVLFGAAPRPGPATKRARSS